MNNSQSRRPNPAERVDFICKIQYGNQLPDLPFEPKFLEAPFVSLNRFVDYKPTSLEKNYKYELLTEPDLNVKIDLIDPMTYFFDPDNRPPLHAKDEKLLEDESVSQQNFKRSLQHSKVVPFMRKTEYISTEFNRYGIGADRQESKIGYGTRKKFATEPNNYKDRESQIAAIQRTFDDVKKPAKKHYSKLGVYAVSETPVLPDFEMWGFPFAQVIFDADPLPLCKNNREQKLEQAVLRGMMDSEGNQFVGYFSPTESAMAQKTEDDEQLNKDSARVDRDGNYKPGFEYEYQLEREYTWTVKNKATVGYEQENYFFVMRGDAAFYNELESRVRLVRRLKSQFSRNSMLFVKYRPTTNKETKAMNARIRHILYPHEVLEDEEVEEEEEEEIEESERMENAKDESDEDKGDGDKESEVKEDMEEGDKDSENPIDSDDEAEDLDQEETEELGKKRQRRKVSESEEDEEEQQEVNYNEKQDEEEKVFKQPEVSSKQPSTSEEESSSAVSNSDDEDEGEANPVVVTAQPINQSSGSEESDSSGEETDDLPPETNQQQKQQAEENEEEGSGDDQSSSVESSSSPDEEDD